MASTARAERQPGPYQRASPLSLAGSLASVRRRPRVVAPTTRAKNRQAPPATWTHLERPRRTTAHAGERGAHRRPRDRTSSPPQRPGLARVARLPTRGTWGDGRRGGGEVHRTRTASCAFGGGGTRRGRCSPWRPRRLPSTDRSAPRRSRSALPRLRVAGSPVGARWRRARRLQPPHGLAGEAWAGPAEEPHLLRSTGPRRLGGIAVERCGKHMDVHRAKQDESCRCFT